MASVKLVDIIDIITFRDLAADNLPELTDFSGSGVIQTGGYWNTLASADGQTAELPYWRDLDPNVAENYSSDDDTSATPNKVVQDEVVTRKMRLNQGWSAKDVARELQTNTDAMRHVRTRVDTYWARRLQRKLISITIGIFNANANNNLVTQLAGGGDPDAAAGDMIEDRSIADGDNAVAANLFSRDAFVAAAYTMGDHVNDLAAVVCHSVIEKRMVDLDDIDYIRDSDGQLLYKTYMGLRVVVDDNVPVVAGGTSGFIYITLLFGRAAFAFGQGSPEVPVEIDRNPAIGDGGGEETLWTRETWLLHPLGFTNTGAVKSEKNSQQNNSDLEDESNWNRSTYRKNVPFAFLATNG